MKADSKAKHGGKREGAGRKGAGKGRFTLSLTAENVEKAKGKTDNLSATVDALLERWLKT